MLINENKKHVLLKDVKCGEVFKHGDAYFIKIFWKTGGALPFREAPILWHGRQHAVCLYDGKLITLPTDIVVSPVASARLMVGNE